MNIEQIIGSIVIAILLSVLVGRRVIKHRKAKQQEKEIEKKEGAIREKSMTVIRKRTIGGEALVDYAVYEMTLQEKVKYSLIAAAVIFGISYLFYDNWIVSLIAACFGMIYPKFKKKDLRNKRQNELSLQFKEAISSLASSMAAGQSIENAFRDVLKDLKLLYPDENTYIIKEFQLINRRIENGEIIERALDDFAKRSDIDDVKNFSDVFITCKRTGGDLVEIIKRTADIISDKIEIQQDIKVLVSQKKFESKIMAIAPLGIVGFLRTSSPDFVAPLYEFGSPGPIVMTVVLICVGCSLLISQKIMDIKI